MARSHPWVCRAVADRSFRGSASWLAPTSPAYPATSLGAVARAVLGIPVSEYCARYLGTGRAC